MSLKYFVHVSSISNLSDARYCSGMMVDSLGYNLDENSNNILSIDSVKEISQWVNGVKFIAEFYNSSEEHINIILENEIFDAIQLNIENKIKNINFKQRFVTRKSRLSAYTSYTIEFIIFKICLNVKYTIYWV